MRSSSEVDDILNVFLKVLQELESICLPVYPALPPQPTCSPSDRSKALVYIESIYESESSYKTQHCNCHNHHVQKPFINVNNLSTYLALFIVSATTLILLCRMMILLNMIRKNKISKKTPIIITEPVKENKAKKRKKQDSSRYDENFLDKLGLSSDDFVTTKDNFNELLSVLLSDETKDIRKLNRNKKHLNKKASKTAEIQSALAKKREERSQQQSHANAKEIISELDRLYHSLLNAGEAKQKERVPLAEIASSEAVKKTFVFSHRLFSDGPDFQTEILSAATKGIINFKFDPQDNRFNHLKSSLEFIFNFHCYNNIISYLADRKSTKIADIKYKNRANFIHSLQYIGVSDQVMLETQATMKTIMASEILKLSPDRSDHQYRFIENVICEIERLTGISRNVETKNSVEKTAIFELIQDQDSRANKDKHKTIEDEAFLTWLKTTIVPTLNSLADDSKLLRTESNLHAIYALILITGEYCSKSRAHRLRAVDTNVTDFVSRCAELRNVLAHNSRRITLVELEILLSYAEKINSQHASDIVLDRILMPLSQAKLNAKAAPFVPKNAPVNPMNPKAPAFQPKGFLTNIRTENDRRVFPKPNQLLDHHERLALA